MEAGKNFFIIKSDLSYSKNKFLIKRGVMSMRGGYWNSSVDK